MDNADREGHLIDFVIKAPQRNRALDYRYAPYFSQDLQAAWREAEREMVQKTCGGHYVDGDICGLDYSPLSCAQDFSEIGYRYRTLRSDSTTAIIGMRWAEHDDVVATYRMIRAKNRWVMDGVSCATGQKFHWK